MLLSVRLSVCLFVCLSVCLSVCVSLSLSVCRFHGLSAYKQTRGFIFALLFVMTNLHLFVCHRLILTLFIAMTHHPRTLAGSDAGSSSHASLDMNRSAAGDGASSRTTTRTSSRASRSSSSSSSSSYVTSSGDHSTSGSGSVVSVRRADVAPAPTHASNQQRKRRDDFFDQQVSNDYSSLLSSLANPPPPPATQPERDTDSETAFVTFDDEQTHDQRQFHKGYKASITQRAVLLD